MTIYAAIYDGGVLVQANTVQELQAKVLDYFESRDREWEDMESVETITQGFSFDMDDESLFVFNQYGVSYNETRWLKSKADTWEESDDRDRG